VFKVKDKAYWQQLIRLAFPITMGQLGIVLMGVVDVVMLGQYNTNAMSAAGVGSAVFFLTALLGMGTLQSVSTLISIAVGEGKPAQTLPIFKQSFAIAGLLLIAILGINYCLYLNFAWFKQVPEIQTLAQDYFKIASYSLPAVLLFNNGKYVLDGLGKTAIAMWVTIIGLLLNVILNYILIYGHLGFDAMGLIGAVWATVIARYVMAVVMLIWAWWHPMIKHLRTLVPEPINYRIMMLKIGLPIGFTYFFEIAAFSAALIIAGQLSALHAGAHQIAINLASITYMFVVGISTATTIMIGNHFGAKDAIGIKRITVVALQLTILLEGFFALLIWLLKDIIPHWYTNDTALLNMTPGLLIMAALFQVSDGVQAVGAGVLRGMKDTLVSGIIAFISYWLLMIPGAYFWAKTHGIVGIWTAMVTALTLAALLMVWRLFIKVKAIHLNWE
jgi:MATE family multidrug resistance protein